MGRLRYVRHLRRKRPVANFRLSRDVLNAVWRTAATEWPRECCGLLLGPADESTRIICVLAIPNTHPDPRRRFMLDPLSAAMAEREARTRGLQVVGYFHSHPTGRPIPSREDLAGTMWAGCGPRLHLIVAGRAAQGGRAGRRSLQDVRHLRASAAICGFFAGPKRASGRWLVRAAGWRLYRMSADAWWPVDVELVAGGADLIETPDARTPAI